MQNIKCPELTMFYIAFFVALSNVKKMHTAVETSNRPGLGDMAKI